MDANCVLACKDEYVGNEYHAVYKKDDGIVIIDPVKSVGQRQIVSACPHGMIFVDPMHPLPQMKEG